MADGLEFEFKFWGLNGRPRFEAWCRLGNRILKAAILARISQANTKAAKVSANMAPFTGALHMFLRSGLLKANNRNLRHISIRV